MKLYFSVLRFSFTRYFAYPLEIVGELVRKALSILLLLAFWTIALGSSGGEIVNLFGYFLLADGISVMVMSYQTMFGRHIRKRVKNGEISAIMLRPVDTALYMYAETLGTLGIRFIIALISIITGLVILSPSIGSLLLFLVAMPAAIVTGFALNLFEGSLSFIFTEISGFKNAIRHISNLFSGRIVPLQIFPSAFQNIAYFSPFSTMVFTPIAQIISGSNQIPATTLLLVGYSWAIVLVVLCLILYFYVQKHYEAVGL